MTDFSWGKDPTQFFFQITPDKVLDAVESAGLECTGRCMALNSMENRVYDVELENESDDKNRPKHLNFRIAKFYRPGRWSKEQILEEHEFLLDLQKIEIPVVAPLAFDDGTTLKKVPDTDIWYSIFPKVGGRSPEEMSDEQVQRIGRLLARIHNCGAIKPGSHRIELSPNTYGRQNLSFLTESNLIPLEFQERYKTLVNAICDLSEPWFQSTKTQRIHGDCHFGNLLWGNEGPFFLDFDDMVRGPCIQDIWLIMPGRDDQSQEQRKLLIEAYSEMCDFDPRSIRLIEPLRALRFVHFSAWIGKRWDDPAFPKTFPYYGSHKYWNDQVADLQIQLDFIQQTAQGSGGMYL